MRLGKVRVCLPVLLASVLAVGLAGCGEAPPADAVVDDHSGHDHDHEPASSAAGEPHAEGHSHGAGPHGGTITEWGAGDYHLEFTVDHDAKAAVVYVLGGDAATPAAITAVDAAILLTIREPAFQVELAAWPMDGEAEGMASRYRGVHESLGIVREFAGTISGAVGDTPYAGDFSEEAHEH